MPDETPTLPLPDLPAGAVSITFQCNLPGYPATSRVLAPRVTAKLQQYVSQVNHIVDGELVQGYPGLTDMFQDILDKHLIAPAEKKYPDVTPAEIAALEAQLAAAKEALLPTFI